jgi:hypothetical protein
VTAWGYTGVMRWLAILVLAACESGSPGTSHDFVAAGNAMSGGSRCMELGRCNSIVKVDCGSAADGPLYYFDEDTAELINCCGGCCFTPDPAKQEDCRLNCPPAGWTCGD